jgi:hypothetical protein
MEAIPFEEFKQRSIDKHGDIFDFSESVYSTMSSVIEYKCREYNHLQRRTPQQTLNLHCGCTECKIKIKNTEEFISAVKLIHGDKFNFDFCEYFNTNTKVHLICNDCGEHIFPQAHSILGGHGYYNCASNKPIDKEKFLQLCLDVNGEKFDYSRIEYTKYEAPVEIFCKTHEIWFFQKPKFHILGGGCDLCRKEKIGLGNRKPLETFIQQSQSLFGVGSFDYSEVEYINTQTKIKLFCNKHKGWISQTPSGHLKAGCNVCGRLKGSAGRKYTLDEFIQRSIQTHGTEKYFYNNVEYINGDLPVSIICRKHNFMFMQTPYRHVNGSNCPLCAQEQRNITAANTLEEFVYLAKKKHGEQFNYNDVIYVNNRVKVKIFCNTCLDYFMQSPSLHLTQRRIGCPTCKESMSSGERKVNEVLLTTGLKFLPQKSLDGCSHIAPLKFDFVLYDKNDCVIGCVEFNGAQHYRPVCFGGISEERALETLAVVQLRDGIKKEYCEKNNIPLLCIHYNDYKNVKLILSQFIRSLDDYLEPL